MNVTDIIKYLEETQGWKEAPPDHPIYSAPPTTRFINLFGSTPPSKRKRSASPKKPNTPRPNTSGTGITAPNKS